MVVDTASAEPIHAAAVPLGARTRERPPRVPLRLVRAVTTRLAFLAESPAGEECDAGRALGVAPIPLVGPSGRLLGEMLRRARLARVDAPPPDWHPEYDCVGLRPLLWERSDYWVGNVWGFRFHNDDFATLFAGAAEAHERVFAEPEWYARGYGWLRPEFHDALGLLAGELKTWAPEAIVTLGAAATWALTGEASIQECRGTRMTATRVVPGMPVYPTLHPAHIIKDFRMLDPCVEDIRRAAAGVAPQARRLWLEPELADMASWWRRFGGAELLAVDIETTHGQIDCIAFSARVGEEAGAICIPFVDWRCSDRSYWPHAGAERRAWDMVEEWLASPAPKVFQNGLYDVAWLWSTMGLRVRNYRHDTRLMAHVLDPEMPKSLAYLGATYAVPPGPWKLARHGEEKRDA